MSWLLQKVGFLGERSSQQSTASAAAVPAETPIAIIPGLGDNTIAAAQCEKTASAIASNQPDPTRQTPVIDCSISQCGITQIDNDFLNRRFSTFHNGMLLFMTDLAGKSGFSLARKTNRMDKKRALELFDDDNIIQRGHFYCWSKWMSFSRSVHVPFSNPRIFLQKGVHC